MKKEALDVLKNRRSIRKYKPEQITGEELDVVLEAGTYAPTASGKQAPVIVAVQDPDTVAELDNLNAKFIDVEGIKPYYGAPTILLVLVPEGAFAPVEDGSCVMDHLLTAAYAVGLGSCWVHRAKQMFEAPEGKALLKKWGLPENMMGVGSIALGYADGSHPKAAPRKEEYIVKV